VALTIHGAGNDDKSLQAALQDAYESGKLRGKPLMDVRRILDKRRTLGRSANKQGPRKRADVSADALVRTYEREVERQRQLVRKAEYTQHCLMFVSGALRELLADENFVNLLRAEKLETCRNICPSESGREELPREQDPDRLRSEHDPGAAG
jgi:ParB family chromosome partitioning protein